MKLLVSAIGLVAVLTLTAGLRAEPAFKATFTGEKNSIPKNFSVPSGAGTIDLALNGQGDFRMMTGLNTVSLYSGPGAASLANYKVSAVIRIGSYAHNTYAGLVGRYQDASHFYHVRLIGMAADRWALQLYRFSDGVLQLGDSVPVPYVPSSACRLELTFTGNDILVQLFDQPSGGTVIGRLSAIDSSMKNGTAGVRASSSGLPISYESFSIKPLVSGVAH